MAEHPFEAGVEGNGVPEKEEIANIALETELLATPVEELAKTALEKGNFKRGKAVFYESAAACFACHDPPRGAARLGPDLATAKTELSHSQLIESLLYPSTLIDKDFAQVKVLTEDGDMKTGIRISENENEIVLRNLVEPEPTKIAKDDIEALKEMKLSLMPENLVRQLKTRQEFDDLMKYIIEVRKK